jgi:uncharacterized protein YfcZ (UPF0381/DUF406 family)
VRLSAAPTAPVSVTVNTVDVEAQAGSDYEALSQVLTFNVGAPLFQTVTVNVIGDDIEETPDTETFSVQLSNPSGATISVGQAIGTIIDDDGPGGTIPNVSISDVTQAEGTGGTTTFTFTVTLDSPPAAPVSLQYATDNGTALAPDDYTAVPLTTLSFNTGEVSAQIDITVNADSTVEPNETFFVRLSNPIGVVLAVDAGLGTISNDDNTVSISDSSATEGDTDTTLMEFTVRLNGPLASPVTINYATQTVPGSAEVGADFIAPPSGSSVTFPASPVSLQELNFTITIIGDTVAEPTETFLVNLTGPATVTFINSQAVGTIIDNDTPSGLPTINISDASVTEGDSGSQAMNFTVTLSRAANASVQYATVNDSATAGSDYAATSGTITFTSGGTRTQTISVVIFGDTTDEEDERFFINLSNVTGATLVRTQAIGTIRDNDGDNDATATPTARPTITPIPSTPLCADLNGTTNPIIRAQAPAGTVTNGNVYCRVLAENGRFIYVGEAGSVGNEQVLRLGVIHAVDVFGLLAGGVSTREFNNPVRVCLQGTGSLIYLDARGAPRPPVRLTNTSSESGYTCANIPSAGTVVLTGQAGDLPGLNTGAGGGGGSGGPAFALSDCTVTTMMRLNIRVWPGLDGRVLVIVPEGVVLPAFERTRRWYRVTYGEFDGWISAFYVRPQGACGE